MNVKSRYEIYIFLSFNLRYKSSSFVADNMILVLNFNNFTMRIKNLKYYSHVDLNECQFQKIKEKAHNMNKERLWHLYVKHIPSLIRQKCIIGHTSPENELIYRSKSITCIENNVLTTLKRIFECNVPIFNHESESFHYCLILDNRQKFEQQGAMILILMDFDFLFPHF